MNRKLIVAVTVVAAAAGVAALAKPASVAACGSRCGVVRWAVKTIGTATVPSVWATESATVAQINAVTAPSPYPGRNAGRTAPLETTFITVKACIWGISNQADKDYHLMINDLGDKTKTMIAEVPSTVCTDACDSPFKDKYDEVRAELDKSSTIRAAIELATARRRALMANAATRDQPGIALVQRPSEISLIGAGFWDTRGHGKGHSDNGSELHPLVAAATTTTTCATPPPTQIKAMLAEPDDD